MPTGTASPADVEEELGLTFYDTAAAMVPNCDVVTINTPLYPETEHLFDDALIATMKRGSFIVNTARGKICDRDAIVRALESGRLATPGTSRSPAAGEGPPWRHMPHHGMTPISRGRHCPPPRRATPPACGRSWSAGWRTGRSATSI